VAAPVTLTLVSVPTDVILGCAAVVTVPAVVAEVAEVADEALAAKVALATDPVTLAPGIKDSPAPEPINSAATTLAEAEIVVPLIILAPVMLPVAPEVTNPPPVMLPVTDKLANVPNCVMLVCIDEVSNPLT
jgi:hypothetical protein